MRDLCVEQKMIATVSAGVKPELFLGAREKSALRILSLKDYLTYPKSNVVPTFMFHPFNQSWRQKQVYAQMSECFYRESFRSHLSSEGFKTVWWSSPKITCVISWWRRTPERSCPEALLAKCLGQWSASCG